MDKTEVKLKAVAEEIKEVLRKHNIAGAIALHDVGHAECILHLNPSYSCAYIYNDESIRFYCKREEFKTSLEMENKLVATSNMLSLLTSVTANNFMMLEPLTKRFDELVGAEHGKLIKK